MSWKPEVYVDGGWYPNALVFETKREAEDYARDLVGRWLLARDYRAVESKDPVKYTYSDGVLQAVES